MEAEPQTAPEEDVLLDMLVVGVLSALRVKAEKKPEKKPRPGLGEAMGVLQALCG